MKPRKPWGWYTRYRHHKQDEPIYIPNFLGWWDRHGRKNLDVDRVASAAHTGDVVCDESRSPCHDGQIQSSDSSGTYVHGRGEEMGWWQRLMMEARDRAELDRK
jgi:hypothetical protein